MHFRPSSLHKECTQCVRHKAMIAELCGHVNARQKQQAMYYAHLRNQFLDRHSYWASRGKSRLRGCDICVIIDGMDQAKFCVPRHQHMRAAIFDAFQRPRLHVSGLICHGHHLLMSVSEPNLKKDANTCLEMLGHSMTLLEQSGVQLSAAHLHVQCDNTSRELKNNVTLRFGAAMVSSGLLASFTLNSLRTGHSHEDIDAVFGALAKHLVRCRVVNNDVEYVSKIQEFLDKVPRPHEPHRKCLKLDQTRDWSL